MLLRDINYSQEEYNELYSYFDLLKRCYQWNSGYIILCVCVLQKKPLQAFSAWCFFPTPIHKLLRISLLQDVRSNSKHPRLKVFQKTVCPPAVEHREPNQCYHLCKWPVTTWCHSLHSLRLLKPIFLGEGFFKKGGGACSSWVVCRNYSGSSVESLQQQGVVWSKFCPGCLHLSKNKWAPVLWEDGTVQSASIFGLNVGQPSYATLESFLHTWNILLTHYFNTSEHTFVGTALTLFCCSGKVLFKSYFRNTYF